jgi:hypothetical protein
VDPTDVPVAAATRARLARSGGALSVFRADSDGSEKPTPPRPRMTLAGLDALIEALRESEDDEDAQAHEERHQTLQAAAESLEQQDAREA